MTDKTHSPAQKEQCKRAGFNQRDLPPSQRFLFFLPEVKGTNIPSLLFPLNTTQHTQSSHQKCHTENAKQEIINQD